jgi:hypothetical protein
MNSKTASMIIGIIAISALLCFQLNHSTVARRLIFKTAGAAGQLQFLLRASPLRLERGESDVTLSNRIGEGLLPRLQSHASPA